MNEQELDSNTTQYVTVVIGGQLFGIPIGKVHDVFMPESITRVPRSENEIAGVLNLRGRIVTAIDMRRLLGLGDRDEDGIKMAVGIEYRGESYGFIIDNVGEVLNLSDDSREANPTNLNKNWTNISAGVHRLEGQLMVILDVEKLLGSMMERIAA
ncbi:MAG: chemotaxis protein CheW [Hyphomicrobiales bacterium]